MSATIKMLIPEATRNYIQNPAFRYDTTGWISSGSTLSRVITQARFNISSMQVVTNGLAIGEGAYYRVNALDGISDNIAGSIYVIGSGIVRLRVIDNPSGDQYVSENIELRSDRWQRIGDVTGRITGSNDVRLYIETAGRIQAATFYVDGAQLERKPYSTSYCDGDQEDCFWTVYEHGSQSYRFADTNMGGRWVDLTNYDPDLYVTVIGGLGVAPIRANLQPYADSPGSYYENFKIVDRIITMTFHVKAAALRDRCNISLDKLHNLRQTLWQFIQPDKGSRRQPIVMEYSDGGVPIYVKVRYDGGMEGDWDIRNKWVQSFPVRFLAVEPLVTNDNRIVSEIDFSDSLSAQGRISARVDGRWTKLNYGFNGPPYEFVIGKRGEIIAAGNFNRANNDPDAIDPRIFANFICWWDGTQWQQFGSGANDIVNSVTVSPNGYVYATGMFTSIGGVAANYVAYWDGSAWNAMGTGLDGAGLTIRAAPNGDIYVGGTFTTADGNPAYNVARWDGGSWHPIGLEGGLDDSVRSIEISDDGTQIYMGGDFTDEFGDPGNLALNYCAYYDPTFDQFDELGDGFNDVVRKVVLSPSGDYLYACGDFTGSATTGEVLLYVAYWNGAQWFPMGSGADDTVRNLAIDIYGNVLAVGNFLTMGGVDAEYFAYWNGSAWTALDIEFVPPIAVRSFACLYDRYNNIYLGTSNAVNISGITTVNNIGSAESYPTFYIVGPGILRYIENITARRRMYLDLQILENEEITIDTSTGEIQSNVRGNIAYSLIEGSEIRAMKLLPGNNEIAMFITNDVDAQASIAYTPRHWGADGTQQGEL